MTNDQWSYVESLCALQHQATAQVSMLRDGVRRWGGGTTRAAIRQTCDCILADCNKLADMDGDGEWIDNKRRFAYSIISELFPQDTVPEAYR